MVDKDKCISCGLCVNIAPKSFRLKKTKAELIDPPGDNEKTIREATDSCPVEAITIV